MVVAFPDHTHELFNLGLNCQKGGNKHPYEKIDGLITNILFFSFLAE